MKILHTSDWHLGRSLYGKKRYEEASSFLNWLVSVIEEEGIDILLVAGDVFDNSTPSNRAQQLYYRFLSRVSGSCCGHIVVIAGNHDSPSFLTAPKELLCAMNVHVTGSADCSSEVLVLNDDRDHPMAVVCAVPYLRDRDIRTVDAGESLSDKTAKLLLGLRNHYEAVFALTETRQLELAESGCAGVPVVAMGHLFTTGGKTVDGDGVRELYTGSLAHVNHDVFSPLVDYVALGHLHSPQSVGNSEHIRYSGSPVPMGFGESKQQKSVVIVEIDSGAEKFVEISLFPVPCFQQLVRIVGSLDEIHSRIEQLKQEKSKAWLEIEYTGKSVVGNLREDLNEALAGSEMEILRIRNRQIYDRVVNAVSEDETLDDLEPGDVFQRCLDVFDVPVEEQAELTASYDEIVKALHEDDSNRE
ncbi:MAG: exonuclease SbcCD subunit D C-terminal domain-containing protein [Candidatus Sabulitectum sp.]|nr:exonuclease SbcCD subunit D C-terminal domain-containing protein [Candidatus Sabulitectum sp.]